ARDQRRHHRPRPEDPGPRQGSPRHRPRARGAPVRTGMEERFVNQPIIAVLAGGTSPEREVSLGSGKAAALAMAYNHPTQFFTVDADALPEGLDPARHIVCSTLHGVFGED